MKRAVLFMICVVLALCLIACSAENPSLPQGDKDRSETTSENHRDTSSDTHTETTSPENVTFDETETEEPSLPIFTGTRSVQQRTAKSGRGASTSGYSYMVKQDDTLFFTTHDGCMCDISMEPGSMPGVLFILSDVNCPGLIEFQAVGEWIYLLQHPNYGNTGSDKMTLFRVKLNGRDLQVIRNDIVSKEFNTFIVRDGFVYCTVATRTQVSASNFKDVCELIMIDLNSGDTKSLYSLENNQDLHICAYNDDKAILQADENLLMLDLNTQVVENAPSDMASFGWGTDSACSWMPGPDGGFWLYVQGHGALYRFLPETGYTKEMCADLTMDMGRYEQPTTSSVCEFVFLDRDTFITNCAGNIRQRDSLWLVKNGERTLIVEDYGANLSWPGDGYLYYTYRSMAPLDPCGDRNCRIKLDGSGWESLNW